MKKIIITFALIITSMTAHAQIPIKIWSEMNMQELSEDEQKFANIHFDNMQKRYNINFASDVTDEEFVAISTELILEIKEIQNRRSILMDKEDKTEIDWFKIDTMFGETYGRFAFMKYIQYK